MYCYNCKDETCDNWCSNCRDNCDLCTCRNQPERLNPEDARERRELQFFIENKGNLSDELQNFKDPTPLTYVCDSLTSTNK